MDNDKAKRTRAAIELDKIVKELENFNQEKNKRKLNYSPPGTRRVEDEVFTLYNS